MSQSFNENCRSLKEVYAFLVAFETSFKEANKSHIESAPASVPFIFNDKAMTIKDMQIIAHALQQKKDRLDSIELVIKYPKPHHANEVAEALMVATAIKKRLETARMA